MSRPPPAKLVPVSEATREREAFKYNPYLPTSFRFVSDGDFSSDGDITTSPDPILTAIAQLGLEQTGAERAFISLFDATHQYVLVEVAHRTRDAPSPAADRPSLRGSALPRNQGACDHVLFVNESLVPDLDQDPRFTGRPYCQYGPGGQFYAGVPIRTRRGINIGTYCVLSTTQPVNWGPQSTQRLHDLSEVVMETFELRRCSYDTRQHQRLNRGLGSFIEGRGTLGGWRSDGNVDAFVNHDQFEGNLNAQQQRNDQDRNEGHDMAQDYHLSPSSSHGLRIPFSSPSTGNNLDAMSPSADKLSLDETASTLTEEELRNNVFGKAANIIRESFEVEGCVFLDAPHRPESASINEDTSSGTGSSSDEQSLFDPSTARDSSSAFLGFSTTTASSIDGPQAVHRGAGRLKKSFLAKLLKRYPCGRIFNFDAGGELMPSDSSEDDAALALSPHHNRSTTFHRSAVSSKDQKSREQRRLKEGAMIRRAFPSARSVAFVPVWDARRYRWVAGGFIYTQVHTRIFTMQGELSFFSAFAKLVAAELLDLETLQAEKAKSDALGSLSHEFRSPLHGAILSTELLNDSDLSVFQSNATHTIETCCRTLLDTIEHLLDFAKVNSFASEKGSEHRGSARELAPHHQFGKKSLYKHTRLDRLVEEVVESAYAGFSFQRLSSAQLASQKSPKDAFTTARRTYDGDTHMGQDGQTEQPISFGNVAIYVTIEPGDWMYHVQPGAFRRIVLNLVGNALRYTTSGTIRVSLSRQKSGRSPSDRLVKLTVRDTGKGISEDYLRNKLFQPFAQEDELMPGTGLGLSLVKKTVTQLRGKVNVASRVGIGTTVTVLLPLHQGSRESRMSPHVVLDEDRIFEEEVQELKGLRVAIYGFESQWGETAYESLKTICCEWLGLEVVTGDDKIPDVVIRSEGTMPTSLDGEKSPSVVVCRHAPSAWELSTEFDQVDKNRIFEFMSQPIGPRVLGRSMLRAYHRWADLPKPFSKSRTPTPKGLLGTCINENLPSRPKSSLAATTESPFAPPPENPELAVAETTKTENPSPEPPTKHESRATAKFLLVDDNRINLKVLSAFMGKLGYSYTTATNGQEAVDAYKKEFQNFAGILMDISMPVMDGLEATRHIRNHERKSQLERVTIIALTGLAAHQTHKEALDSGVDIFMSKPVDLKTLTEVLSSSTSSNSATA